MKDIERYSQEHGLPKGLKFRHVQVQGIARLIHRLHLLPGLWFLYYEAYRRWQLQALEIARELHSERPFDLAHQLTIITFREPGYLWRMNIPWFWGPINGAANIPWSFLPSLGPAGCYRHVTRNLLNQFHTRFSFRCRTAAKRAAKIWTVTREDQKMVERIWKCPAEAMIETGATPKPAATPRARGETEPLRLAWCGLIEARKALGLLLSAIAGLPQGCKIELHVIGDGPEEPRCRRLAQTLGLSSIIKWHGRVSHDEAQALLNSCHILVHTALKEGTPHVVLEAMSQGLPVICHDACGMGIAVDETCGIKIPLTNPKASIQGFQAALGRVYAKPDLLEELSQGAIARASQLTWESHVVRMGVTYQRALNGSSPNSRI